MEKVKIITDSNSGISQAEGESLGIFVIPMPFLIAGDEFEEEISISQDEFYEKLKSNPSISTSCPAPGYLMDLWDTQLKEYDSIVYIPMSSGLSSTCTNARRLAEEYAGRVQVVDNQRISVTQKMSVYEAVELAKQGKSALEIRQYLEKSKDKASIYICVDTLKYLKQGGRISATAAALGSMLRVKPILSSRGGRFEKFAMAMSMGQAKRRMMQQIKLELEGEFKEEYQAGKMVLFVAHTYNETEAQKFKEEVEKDFNMPVRFVDPLSLSVSCHIGPGALALAMAVNEYAKF
ncbi:MAG: DegV family protein [Clostridiales bacterium]|nr:DegV family protein [Clostridiales bacterium]